MPSVVDQRIASRMSQQQVEALLRVEGIADTIDVLIGRKQQSILTLLVSRAADERRIPEIAAVLRELPELVRQQIDLSFPRLARWTYDDTVKVIAETIPRHWYRREHPVVMTVGEGVGYATEADAVPIIALPPAAFGETPTEPVVRKRLGQAEWEAFAKKNIFLPPSAQRVQQIIGQPINGVAWPDRVQALSKLVGNADALASDLVLGYSSGESAASLAQRVQIRTQGIKASARRIVRTEGLRVAEAIRQESYQQLGSMLQGQQIVATLDEVTRPEHAARNGRIYFLQPGLQPNIQQMPQLPDEPNCRCLSVPVLRPPAEFEADPAVRAEFQTATGAAIPDPSVYSDWFAQADNSRRKIAVGARRYRAVQQRLAGVRDVEWTDFIDPDGKLLTVKDIQHEDERQRQQRKQLVDQALADRRDLLRQVQTFGFVLPPAPASTAVKPQTPASTYGHHSLTRDGVAVKVTTPNADLLGFQPQSFANFVAAPKGATVTITKTRNAVNVSVKEKRIESTYDRKFTINSGGQLQCDNEYFMIKDKYQGNGLGAKIFAEQVYHLASVGAAKITTVAARGRKLNGYYTWAKLGYDGRVPSDVRQKAKGTPFESYTKVSEFMATAAGVDWWRINGDQFIGTFDLTPGSYSRTTLEKYMQDRFGDQRAVEHTAGSDTASSEIGEEELAEAVQERAEEIDWDERDERASNSALQSLRKSNPEFFGKALAAGQESLDNPTV